MAKLVHSSLQRRMSWHQVWVSRDRPFTCVQYSTYLVEHYHVVLFHPRQQSPVRGVDAVRVAAPQPPVGPVPDPELHVPLAVDLVPVEDVEDVVFGRVVGEARGIAAVPVRQGDRATGERERERETVYTSQNSYIYLTFSPLSGTAKSPPGLRSSPGKRRTPKATGSESQTSSRRKCETFKAKTSPSIPSSYLKVHFGLVQCLLVFSSLTT